VQSTEPVLVSDYPFFWPAWPQFDEKRQPDFQELPFLPLIGDLTLFPCPEMTTFSNDTGRDILPDGLEAVRERGAGKWQGTPFPVIIRSPIVSADWSSCTGNIGSMGGAESTEAISASVSLVFRPV